MCTDLVSTCPPVAFKCWQDHRDYRTGDPHLLASQLFKVGASLRILSQIIYHHQWHFPWPLVLHRAEFRLFRVPSWAELTAQLGWWQKKRSALFLKWDFGVEAAGAANILLSAETLTWWSFPWRAISTVIASYNTNSSAHRAVPGGTDRNSLFKRPCGDREHLSQGSMQNTVTHRVATRIDPLQVKSAATQLTQSLAQGSRTTLSLVSPTCAIWSCFRDFNHCGVLHGLPHQSWLAKGWLSQESRAKNRQVLSDEVFRPRSPTAQLQCLRKH